MRAKSNTQPSEPPTLQPQMAIALIRRQSERLSSLGTLHFDDPGVTAWESTTRDILDRAFGKPNGESHNKTNEVIYASGGQLRVNMSHGELQRNHGVRTKLRETLLAAYIEQLEDGLAPPVLPIPGYGFHSEIEKVSGTLLRHGHFKQAALEAYIRVIEGVKDRSGLLQDGDQLMNHAFGSETRAPILAFNSLTSVSEKDEQKGIMLLFKGIVGLRNSKAHSNALFDDPSRAHEYLALASLLMRLLDISIVTQP